MAMLQSELSISCLVVVAATSRDPGLVQGANDLEGPVAGRLVLLPREDVDIP